MGTVVKVLRRYAVDVSYVVFFLVFFAATAGHQAAFPSEDCYLVATSNEVRALDLLANQGCGGAREVDRLGARACEIYAMDQPDVYSAVMVSLVQEGQGCLVRDEPHEQPAPTAARGWFLAFRVMLSATFGLGAATAAMAIVAGSHNDLQVNTSSAGAGWSIAIVGTIFLGVALSWGELDFGPFDDIGQPFTRWTALGTAMLGSVSIGTVTALGLSVSEDSPPKTLRRSKQIAALIVTGLSATVSVGVLAAAARWQSIGHLPGADSIPSLSLLLYGAAFSAVIAILYVPSASQFNRLEEHWIGSVIDTELPEAAPYSKEALELRKAIRSDLAHNRSPLGALGSVVSVVAPIATATAAAAL